MYVVVLPLGVKKFTVCIVTDGVYEQYVYFIVHFSVVIGMISRCHSNYINMNSNNIWHLKKNGTFSCHN